MGRLMLKKEVCTWLGVSRPFLNKLIAERGFPVHIPSGRIDREQVEEWLRQNPDVEPTSDET